MYQIVVFIPLEHTEKVKSAMFNAGGGQLGNYENCSFEHQGMGQFRPLTGSNPFLGTVGEIERVTEVKVEMICSKNKINEVIAALKMNHPYETPAYYVIETLNI